MRVLDLFSGIGGFSLGLEATGGFNTVAFCEIEPYCQKILKKHWPDVPILNDIKEVDFEQFRGAVDVITGGYPCQPFSVAGRQKGEEDPRHLWPRMREIIAQVRPTWVVCENVYGHIKLGLDSVLLDLENQGYTTRPFVVPACSVNAPHRRNRLWIIAHAEHYGSSTPTQHRENERNVSRGQERQKQPQQLEGIHSPAFMADSISNGTQRLWTGGEQITHSHEKEEAFMRCGKTGRFTQWDVEPSVGRVVNGLPNRVDRIKALGNSIVPQLAFNIGKAILYAEEKKAKRKSL